MAWQSVVEAVILGLAVAVQWLCVLGVILMPNVFDQLHFVTPAATVGVGLVLVAVLFAEWLDPAGVQMLVAAGALFVTGPVLTHATARAAHIRQYGSWLEAASEHNQDAST